MTILIYKIDGKLNCLYERKDIFTRWFIQGHSGGGEG